MSDLVVALIALVGTALVTFFGTYGAAREQLRRELLREYDVDLRRLRLDCYPQLWVLTEPLAAYRHGMHSLPALRDLEEMTVGLRRWYFRSGGLFLSATTRDAYLRLQTALGAVVGSERWDHQPGASIDGDTFLRLRRIASELRTRLTVDTGTRKTFSQEQEIPDRPGPENDRIWIEEQWGRSPDAPARPD